MIKFISEDVGGTKIEYTTEENVLPDILMHFEAFLRGAGYSFDGHLDIVNEEETSGAEEA